MGKGSKPRPVDRKKWDECPLWNKSPPLYDFLHLREKDLRAIELSLKEVLAVEIIYSAMNRLKSNPEISIAEAMEYGYLEWIK